MKPKMKLTWWALTDGELPSLHAVRGDRKAALCGSKLGERGRQVSGPKKIERHPKCARCVAHIERFGFMVD
jgi:hypothetical protein